ncbi:MAG: MarR family transcriptional regulator [Schleiferilactobacillus perolens]|uniref:MarR family winged helix-turn-helix transcriptional regulator n=1 Tax=Schleiferilactobacillus perolens TaxID=100468 RepID=UPI0039EB532F
MSNNSQDVFRAFRRFGHFSRRLAWQQPQPPHHHGQARLLRVIADQDQPTSAQLAEILDIRPSSVSELLGKLENAGFITREQDPDDKRASRIHITEAGQAKLSEAERAQTDFADQVLAGLSDEEQQQLLALLNKANDHLAETVKDIPDDDQPPFGFEGPHRHHGGPHGFGGPRGPRGFGGDGPHFGREFPRF